MYIAYNTVKMATSKCNYHFYDKVIQTERLVGGK